MRAFSFLGFKLLLALIILGIGGGVKSQTSNYAPSGIPFQGLLRDNSNMPAKNRAIIVRSTLLNKNDTVVYGEIFGRGATRLYTNQDGVFTIILGQSGDQVTGSTAGFSAINWQDGPYYLKVEVAMPTTIEMPANWDYTKNFKDMGKTQLWSVPYALSSGSTASISGGKPLTSKDNIIKVINGDSALLVAAQLGIDTTNLGKLVINSSVRDSIIKIIMSTPAGRDSIIKIITTIIREEKIPGNALKNGNGIIVTGGDSAVLRATSLRLDSSVVAKQIGKSPVSDSIANLVINNTKVRDSIVKLITNNVNGSVVGKNLSSYGLIVNNGTASTLKDVSLILDSSVVAKQIGKSPVSDSIANLVINNTKVRDSIIKIIMSTPAGRDSIIKIITTIIREEKIPGNALKNGNGIIVTGGDSAVLRATSLRLDSSVVAKQVVTAPVSDSIASLITNSTKVRDSIIKIITNTSAGKDSIVKVINSTAWGLSGNTGTNAGTNFVGTTDNQNLVFKRNNVYAGLLDSSLSSTSFGVRALPNNIGFGNTAVGDSALIRNSTGTNNVGLGHSSLANNNTGKNNTGVGALSLHNSTGDNNTAIGYRSGHYLIMGNNNILLGANTFLPNTSENNQINIGNTIYAINSGTGSSFVGINTPTPGNTLEINHGTSGNSGLRLKNLPNTNATVTAGAGTVNGKYLSVNSVGDVVLARLNDPIVSVYANKSFASPILGLNLTDFQSFSFENNAPKTDSSVIYINNYDGSQWIYTLTLSAGGAYQSYTPPGTSAWFIAGTAANAANNTTNAITRSGAVSIGSASTPQASSILELKSTDRGFLMTRVANTAAIANPANGMMIYDLSSNCFKGFQNGAWTGCFFANSSNSSGGTAIIASFDCKSGNPAYETGRLLRNIPVNNVTKKVVIDVTLLGSYNISAFNNGVTFAATGNFTNLGAQELLLTATGTPAIAGTNTFSLNTTPNCTFDWTTLSADPSSGGSAVVSGYVCNTASNGTLMQGTALVAGSATQTITATVTTMGTYNISTAAVNGVTFSASGTFGGTGNQTIVLNASGTPTASGSANFTLNTTPVCSFSRTINSLSSGGTAIVGSFNCAGGTATGTMVRGVAVSGVTQTVVANVTTAGTYNITTDVVNGVSFSASGIFSATGNQTITLTASGTPTGSGGNTTFTLGTTPNCGFSRIIEAGVIAFNCAGTSGGTGTYNSNAVSAISLPYTNGSGAYNAQTIVLSPTINGITYTANLAGGSLSASGNLTFTITPSSAAAPGAAGLVTGTVSLFGQTCTLSVSIAGTAAVDFTNPKNNVFVYSVNNPAKTPVVSGSIPVGGLPITLPYKVTTAGSYPAYTSPDIAIPAAYTEGGASGYTFSYSYSGGTVMGATGSINATIKTKLNGVSAAWPARRVLGVDTINLDIAKTQLVFNNLTQAQTVGIDEGGDAIRGALTQAGCASCAAYDAAPYGTPTYIQITAAEYTTLSTVIAGVRPFGASTDNMNFNKTIVLPTSGFTTMKADYGNMGTNSGNTDSYPFAFSFNGLKSNVSNNTISIDAGCRFSAGSAATNTGTTNNIGGTARTPAASIQSSYKVVGISITNYYGTFYFVLKGANTLIPANSYLEIYFSSIMPVCLYGNQGTQGIYRTSDTSSPNLIGTWSQPIVPQAQFLTTPTKQW